MTKDGSRTDGSTLTRMLNSVDEDRLLHRALSLPGKHTPFITLTDRDGAVYRSKYTFESSEPIGEGGSSVVYRIRDTELEVSRAMKVLLCDVSGDTSAASRWRRESELLLALEEVDAACVPTVFDIAVIDGLPVIIMQYVDGTTLSRWLDLMSQRPVPRRSIPDTVETALTVITPIAASLATIEERLTGTNREGLVHGDIKPSNIIIEWRAESGKAVPSGTQVWLLDFGEGLLVDENAPRGVTPAYASPELVDKWGTGKSRRLTSQSDQYQLGAVLGDILETATSSSSRKSKGSSSRGSMADRMRHRRLVRISEKMTARRPENRYPDFTQVLRALEHVPNMVMRQLITTTTCTAFGLMLIAVAAGLLAFLRPSGMADIRDPNVIKMAADSVWEQLLIKDNRNKSDEALRDQLAMEAIAWERNFGATASQLIAADLNRRLAFFSEGGEYMVTFGEVSLSASEAEGRRDYPSPTDFDRHWLEFDVGNMVVGSVEATILPTGQVRIEGDPVIRFAWKPGTRFTIPQWDESPSEREYIKRKQIEIEEYKKEIAQYAEDDPERLMIMNPADMIVRVSIEHHVTSLGTPLEMPIAFALKEFTGDSFRGTYNASGLIHSITITRVGHIK